MTYRTIGEFKVSTFGMGCMRLPHVDGKIDFDESKRMIRRAIEAGVNYFDTAYVYQDGESEKALGNALKGVDANVYVADKLPVWFVKSADDVERVLDTSLERLQRDHVDLYLLHGLDSELWAKAKELKLLNEMERMRAKGKIRSIAFSFHDEFDTYKEIIDGYDDWAMSQIQLNIIDTERQAGLKGMYYAAEKGVPVVIMEPLRGGLIANMPGEVRAELEKHDKNRSNADWGFRFLAQHEEIAVILSGVSTMEQLEENIEIFRDLEPGCFSKEEEMVIERANAILNSRVVNRCTGCRYCMPCEQGVEIPDIFQLQNVAVMFEFSAPAKGRFKMLERGGSGPSSCIECGECEKRCPQHIEIINTLKEAANALR